MFKLRLLKVIEQSGHKCAFLSGMQYMELGLPIQTKLFFFINSQTHLYDTVLTVAYWKWRLNQNIQCSPIWAPKHQTHEKHFVPLYADYGPSKCSNFTLIWPAFPKSIVETIVCAFCTQTLGQNCWKSLKFTKPDKTCCGCLKLQWFKNKAINVFFYLKNVLVLGLCLVCSNNNCL